MRLTELARSSSWTFPSVEAPLNLLAPTPVVIEGELLLVVGRRGKNGSSSLWSLHVRNDLGHAELEPLRFDGLLPKHCQDGLVPTEARSDGSGTITVLFSGFRRAGGRYQLLTGSAQGEVGGELRLDPSPLLPPLPGQNSLRASATFGRAVADTIVYAAGSSWFELEGGSHPTSHIRRKPREPRDDPGVSILHPGDEEFALTRPVEAQVQGVDLLFFSRRLCDGRYLQGLAGQDADGTLLRCDDMFWSGVQSEEPFMYAYPFSWQGRDLAALATSRIGEGGIVLAELQDLT